MTDPAHRVERLLEGLREIREISSLKRLEASVTDDPAVRLRVAGQALERIDTIVSALLDETGEPGTDCRVGRV